MKDVYFLKSKSVQLKRSMDKRFVDANAWSHFLNALMRIKFAG